MNSVHVIFTCYCVSTTMSKNSKWVFAWMSSHYVLFNTIIVQEFCPFSKQENKRDKNAAIRMFGSPIYSCKPQESLNFSLIGSLTLKKCFPSIGIT